MASTIRYIAGFPNELSPGSERFDEVRRQYKLKKENVDVWEYGGPLTSTDFKALEGVLTSEQYLRLKDSKNPKKGRFLKVVKDSIAGRARLTGPYCREQSQSLPNTSEHFLSALEELLNHEKAPLSQVEAQEYLLRQAERSGLYIPISFSYPYRGTEGLAYDRKALIFVDGNLKGEVTLRKTREYFDQFAGQTEEGIATIKIGKRRENVDWNWWQSSFLRWIVDPTIRKEFLKEKEPGIRFTRV